MSSGNGINNHSPPPPPPVHDTSIVFSSEWPTMMIQSTDAAPVINLWLFLWKSLSFCALASHFLATGSKETNKDGGSLFFYFYFILFLVASRDAHTQPSTAQHYVRLRQSSAIAHGTCSAQRQEDVQTKALAKRRKERTTSLTNQQHYSSGSSSGREGRKEGRKTKQQQQI